MGIDSSTRWQRAIDLYGNHRLDQIAPSDILAPQRRVVATVRTRRSSRGGRHAGEHLIRALRNLYKLAVRDELIAALALASDRDHVITELPRIWLGHNDILHTSGRVCGAGARPPDPRCMIDVGSRAPACGSWLGANGCSACQRRCSSEAQRLPIPFRGGRGLHGGRRGRPERTGRDEASRGQVS